MPKRDDENILWMKSEEPWTTNPGSADARRQGCTCDPVLNAFGAGAPDPEQPQRTKFYPLYDCPVHGLDVAMKAERKGTEN